MVLRQHTEERIVEMKNLLLEDAQRRGLRLNNVEILNPIYEWSEGNNKINVGSFISYKDTCHEVLAIDMDNDVFYFTLHKTTNKGERYKSRKPIKVRLNDLDSFTNIHVFKPGESVY